jgi:hypothetical protein
MTTRLLPTVLVIGLAAGALGLVPTSVDAAGPPTQDPAPGELASRLVSLEQQVQLLGGKLELLAIENASLEASVDILGGLAVRQGKQAERLLQVYNEAEELGFTAGINFESRERLLSGLRVFTDDLAKGAAALGKQIPKVRDADYDELNEPGKDKRAKPKK